MSLDSIVDMAGGLLCITAFNAAIAFGLTFVFLVIREKINARKEAMGKKHETFNREL